MGKRVELINEITYQDITIKNNYYFELEVKSLVVRTVKKRGKSFFDETRNIDITEISEFKVVKEEFFEEIRSGLTVLGILLVLLGIAAIIAYMKFSQMGLVGGGILSVLVGITLLTFFSKRHEIGHHLNLEIINSNRERVFSLDVVNPKKEWYLELVAFGKDIRMAQEQGSQTAVSQNDQKTSYRRERMNRFL